MNDHQQNLIKAHLDLVSILAAGFSKHNSDLMSAGYLGLTRAAVSFSAKHKSKASFRTYANSVVRNAMINELRADSHWERPNAKWSRRDAPDHFAATPEKSKPVVLNGTLDCLSDKSRRMISEHFGLVDQPLTIAELADVHSQSERRIKWWISAALTRLRFHVQQDGLE